MDKSEAELFKTLCTFVWDIGALTPLIFDFQAPIYNDAGINFNSMQHLELARLIKVRGPCWILKSWGWARNHHRLLRPTIQAQTSPSGEQHHPSRQSPPHLSGDTTSYGQRLVTRFSLSGLRSSSVGRSTTYHPLSRACDRPTFFVPHSSRHYLDGCGPFPASHSSPKPGYGPASAGPYSLPTLPKAGRGARRAQRPKLPSSAYTY